MSVTVEVDEAVLRKAEDASQIHDHAELVRKALELFALRREAQDRLAALGGTMPNLELPDCPPVEIYTDARLAEFAEAEAELDEVLRRKSLR